MDLDQTTPHTKNLQNLTYSELRKEASKYGINRRMKSEKLISAIMSKLSEGSSSDEMFSTPAMKELNSCRKNKENKFDEVQMTPLTTPRRGTYSLETPVSAKTEDLSSVSLTVNASDLDLSNVTISRGSERKLRPRKVSFMSPAVTPRTPKNRSLRNRPKTPVASRTPLNERKSNAQHKRKSFEESFLGSTPQAKTVKFETEFESVNSPPQPPSTQENKTYADISGVDSPPQPPSTQKNKTDAEISGIHSSPQNVKSNMESIAIPESVNSTPQPLSTQETNGDSEVSRVDLSPRNVKSSAKEEIVKKSTSKKRGTTLSAKKVVMTKEPTSIKRVATPNFRRIHQKAFDQMESIDDYQKRKLMNSAKKIGQHLDFKSKVTKAKSKIPGFNGIPFIPSGSFSSSMKPNTRMNNLVPSGGKRKVVNENTPQLVKKDIDLKALTKNKILAKKDTPQPKSMFDMKNKNMSKRETPQSTRSKSKFDLKASLSRKLTYKPYKGPVKPLTESNNFPAASFISAKEPVINKVVKENRSQTRSMIRGVRMNKRFDLQMKNRKLN